MVISNRQALTTSALFCYQRCTGILSIGSGPFLVQVVRIAFDYRTLALSLSHSSKFERCGTSCAVRVSNRMTGERKLKNIASYRCTMIGYWVTLSAHKFPVGRGQSAASRSGPLPSPTRLDGKSKASSVRALPCSLYRADKPPLFSPWTGPDSNCR